MTKPVDPEVSIDEQPKSRVKRTELERALERHNSKDAACKKLEQRLAAKYAEADEIKRELDVAKKQRELHARMVALAREVIEPESDSPPNYPTEMSAPPERAAQ